MRLGLIARADNSGLGVQTAEFFRHMQPDKTLVIDVGHLHNDSTHTNKATDLTRFPGAQVFSGWMPDQRTVQSFLSGLDVVFSAETFYQPQLAQLARRMGVKTVLQCNPEFLSRNDWPDLWAPPTEWMWDTIPNPKTLLPVPIAADRFERTAAPLSDDKGGRSFLHVVGRPAHEDRNGTRDLLMALEHITAKVTVTIRCQTGGYVSSLAPGLRTNNNVTFIVDPGDKPNYWDLYDGDVLIMPRRFGGLCLPVNEALGAGMPVIMSDISPNNTWLPQEWLVPAGWQSAFVAKQRVDVYGVNPKDLAAKIDRFATDQDFYTKAKAEAARLRTEYSWDNLLPTYRKLLEGM